MGTDLSTTLSWASTSNRGFRTVRHNGEYSPKFVDGLDAANKQ
jgi:hypothetical protein